MKIRTSIRWRIQIWQTCLLTLIVSGLCLLWYQKEKARAASDIDQDLGQRLVTMSRHLPHEAVRHGINDEVKAHYQQALGRRDQQHRQRNAQANRPLLPSRNIDGASGTNSTSNRRRGPQDQQSIQVQQSNDEIFSNAAYSLCAWSQEKIIINQNYSGSEERPTMDLIASGVFRTRDGQREILGSLPDRSIVLIGYDLSLLKEDLNKLLLVLVLCGTAIVLLGFLIGWIATGRAVGPITEINRVSAKIAEGELGERIAIKNPTSEIDSLSKSLNHTFNELEQTFEHLKRFTADASHELRNPIAAMLMEVEVALASSTQGNESQDSLLVCQRNLNQMSELVQSLLALARMDAASLTEKREISDLESVVDLVVDRYHQQADELGIELVSHTEAAPCFIDLGHMMQVLDNLLNNAFKYGATGKKIDVSCRTQGQDVTMTVRDYGQGIAPEHLPHIFERFYRIDDARKFKQGSTGIGLAIVKAFVESNDGTVTATSELGQGTTFTVRLPFSDS